MLSRFNAGEVKIEGLENAVAVGESDQTGYG